MSCIKYNETIDSILNVHRQDLGRYFEQYQNHVYRVFNFAVPYLVSDIEFETISIAAAFHDLGIWTNKTFDYIKPSIDLVKRYSIENKIDLVVFDEIAVIIGEHHKLTSVKNSKLAEIFRQSDLVDLTFGLIRHGRDKHDMEMIKKTFPNKGFHLYLLKLFLKNLITSPWKPLPMYKF